MNVRDTAQLAFVLGSLFCQDVAFESVATLNCSTWTNAKAFLGRAFGLHFWHNFTVG